jgi:BASS family bile acid:Na+ symporter
MLLSPPRAKGWNGLREVISTRLTIHCLMSGILDRYGTFLVVVLSIALGFALPQVGVVWKSYLTPLLMLLMFFVALSLRSREIKAAARNYQIIIIGLSTTLILVPLIGLSTKPFFSSVNFAGVILALSCPSAIVSSFWTKTFKGDVATALVISVITNLLSIITLPVTILVTVGLTLNVNAKSMMLSLAEIILLPMVIALVMREYVHIDWNRVHSFGSRAELGIIVLIIWGSIAAGITYVESDLIGFAILNSFIFSILAIGFAATYLLTRRFGYQRAIAVMIPTTVKNAALSLVIGLTAFSPEILPPLIANLIAQNLLLIPAKAMTKKITLPQPR